MELLQLAHYPHREAETLQAHSTKRVAARGPPSHRVARTEDLFPCGHSTISDPRMKAGANKEASLGYARGRSFYSR